MNLPPSLIHLEFGTAEKRKINLWIPIFLLWPFVLVLLIIAVPVLLVADLVLTAAGLPLNLFRLICGLLDILSALKGTLVSVDSRRKETVIHITIL